MYLTQGLTVARPPLLSPSPHPPHRQPHPLSHHFIPFATSPPLACIRASVSLSSTCALLRSSLNASTSSCRRPRDLADSAKEGRGVMDTDKEGE